MPLPAGWTVTINQFDRTPDGAGGIGVTVAFGLTSPAGQTTLLGPAYAPPLVAFGLTKAAVTRAAWQMVYDYAMSIVQATPTANPAVDPIVGSAFNPP